MKKLQDKLHTKYFYIKCDLHLHKFVDIINNMLKIILTEVRQVAIFTKESQPMIYNALCHYYVILRYTTLTKIQSKST